uniref:Uncharacterized protein n=1 Tax=Alexandrium catenella TaxID=2925 RepID=A0A7S1MIW7_ALECA|mmetsp:Transcript_27738/g.75239  ORF Transcript_27738/g.75239 Transcript_27738/m.75239 type:complete len:128 (+) Transcript_27738:458-841(+)
MPKVVGHICLLLLPSQKDLRKRGSTATPAIARSFSDACDAPLAKVLPISCAPCESFEHIPTVGMGARAGSALLATMRDQRHDRYYLPEHDCVSADGLDIDTHEEFNDDLGFSGFGGDCCESGGDWDG